MHSIVLAVASDTAPFCEFLRAVHVQVCDVEGTTVRASIPGAQSDLHERRELSGYVVTWNALNPARRAEIVS